MDQICDNALSLSVTLHDFFLTILTIINSIESGRMSFVKELGMYPQLLSYLKAAIQANIVLIAVSFLIKYIEHRQREHQQFKE